MTREQIHRYLLPGSAEKDEGFRKEIRRQSHAGLTMIGIVAIAAPMFLLVTWWAFFGYTESTSARVKWDLILAGIGVGVILLARPKWAYRHSRWLALAVVEVVTVLVLASSLYLSSIEPSAEDFIPSQITLGILILVITIPLKPWQAFFHCIVVTVLYVLTVRVAQLTFLPTATVQIDYCLFIAMLTLLSTGLSATLYGQRRDAYFSYRESLQNAEELRQAQGRLAMSESASSMARLAAAISHELNTPIGALTSAVDTLLLLGARQATAPPEQLPRLVKLQAELRKSIQDSSQRLQQIGARVARFTNLDQAAIQTVRINDLVSDVAELVRPRLPDGAELKLELAPGGELVGNPQQLSAVFYDLINNSMGALNGNGQIRVVTSEVPRGIEVRIEDNGRGIDREELTRIFDPNFRERSGRMATGNWSMFNARQIVREHGGEITISSEPGTGTKVTVSLPFGHLT